LISLLLSSQGWGIIVSKALAALSLGDIVKGSKESDETVDNRVSKADTIYVEQRLSLAVLSLTW